MLGVCFLVCRSTWERWHLGRQLRPLSVHFLLLHRVPQSGQVMN